MTQVVLLVDKVTDDGFETFQERIKKLSYNWEPNLYNPDHYYWKKYTGDKVKIVEYHPDMKFEPGVRYFYFIILNNWYCDQQHIFTMLDKKMQENFADNGVSFMFAQDFEMYPNFNFNFFLHWLGFYELMQRCHSFNHIQTYFCLQADLVEWQRKMIQQAFGDRYRFLHSPLITHFTRDELLAKHKDLDIDKVMNDYFSTNKEKQFMSLTRDPKYHRLTLIHGLRAYECLNEGFVSLLMGKDYGSECIKPKSMYGDSVRNDMQRGKLSQMLVDEISESMIPGIQAGIGGDIPYYHMARSFYDIVQETGTTYDGSYPVDMSIITEKLMKSMLFGRPFMVNGGPKCLPVIKRWGFKTYPEVFDESYDDAGDFIDRQEIIVKNVLNYRMKWPELATNIQKSAETIVHNIQKVVQFNFEDAFITELQVNG